MTEETNEVTGVESGNKRAICQNREGYVKARTATGKTTLNNGDEVATLLGGLTLDQTINVGAELLDVKVSELKDHYGHLNLGMQRMVIGNRIRGSVNKLENGIEVLTEMTESYRADNQVAMEEAEKAAIADAEAKAAEKVAADEAKAQAKADKKAAREAAKAEKEVA